jgi:hypothetical protein
MASGRVSRERYVVAYTEVSSPRATSVSPHLRAAIVSPERGLPVVFVGRRPARSAIAAPRDPGAGNISRRFAAGSVKEKWIRVSRAVKAAV